MIFKFIYSILVHVYKTTDVLCRCGIRGGYMEMVGISSNVMDILERYMSSKLCANTVGQVE